MLVGLNPSYAEGTTPVTNQLQYNWGDRAIDGLLAQDWSGVANLAVLGFLQAMIAPHRPGRELNTRPSRRLWEPGWELSQRRACRCFGRI